MCMKLTLGVNFTSMFTISFYFSKLSAARLLFLFNIAPYCYVIYNYNYCRFYPQLFVSRSLQLPLAKIEHKSTGLKAVFRGFKAACKNICNIDPRPKKVYTDLEEWWVKESHCRKSYIDWFNE